MLASESYFGGAMKIRALQDVTIEPSVLVVDSVVRAQLRWTTLVFA
jgi:hypothetical protein